MLDREDDDASNDWSDFHRAALRRPPRELLGRTLGCFAIEGRQPGVAVDLGCGSGPESIELLRRGWIVHAVDADPEGLELLRSQVPPDVRARLKIHHVTFEDFHFPACDLVWSGWSLPYCPTDRWPVLLDRIVHALRPNGRFAGDLFGDRHAWSAESGVFTLTESALREQLAEFVIEAFDVEDGIRPSGRELTRWHAFGIAVRVPR